MPSNLLGQTSCSLHLFWDMDGPSSHVFMDALYMTFYILCLNSFLTRNKLFIFHIYLYRFLKNCQLNIFCFFSSFLPFSLPFSITALLGMLCLSTPGKLSTTELHPQLGASFKRTNLYSFLLKKRSLSVNDQPLPNTPQENQRRLF